MYRPTKSGMGNSVVRLVFVSFDYFSNFQFPEKSSGRGDMTLCQQRDNKYARVNVISLIQSISTYSSHNFDNDDPNKYLSAISLYYHHEDRHLLISLLPSPVAANTPDLCTAAISRICA
jgi:hypothetical protein